MNHTGHHQNHLQGLKTDQGGVLFERKALFTGLLNLPQEHFDWSDPDWWIALSNLRKTGSELYGEGGQFILGPISKETSREMMFRSLSTIA